MQQLNILGNTKEEDAIKFIRKHEPEEGYFVGYSGGKDSDVLVDLVLRSGVKHEIFYSLMHDPPELIRHIKSRPFKVNVIHPKFNFWHGVTMWYPPHRNARWCCNHIKENPSTKVPLTYRLMGLRAEESPNRAKQGWTNQRTKKRINLHPIYNWLEWEVWDYIDTHGIEYCSLYDEGFSRLGCVVCPLRGYKDKLRWKERFPVQHALFEKKAWQWWLEKGLERQRERGETLDFDKFLDNWYRGI